MPQVNAFHIRQFNMMQAAEDAARFLHHACRGLPQRLNGHRAQADSSPADDFCRGVIEDAAAYFGSRVLYPARPAPYDGDFPAISRAAVEKAAHEAARGDTAELEASARTWGYRIGSQIYKIYLAGKVKPSGLRRLFLAHLEKPGAARKVCIAVIAKLRAAAR